MKVFYVFLFCVAFLVLNSCTKKNAWDATLNGIWVAVDPATGAEIPSDQLEISDHIIRFGVRLNYFVAAGVDGINLVSNDNQIYYFHKRTTRNLKPFKEYLFDYEFAGEYLWIVSENTEQKGVIANSNFGLKYKRKQ